MQKLRKAIASLSVIAILSTLVVSTTAFAGVYYDDVPTDTWYASYVNSLAETGVLDTSKDMFYPADNLNRAEAIKLLVEAFSLEGGTTLDFSDVSEDSWYYDYLETAVAKGLIVGYDDGTFLGGNNINRAEWAKIVVVAADLPEVAATSPFPDVPAGVWYEAYSTTAYCYQVVDGYDDGTFGGGNDTTRAQAAKMIDSAMNPTLRAGDGCDGTEPDPEPDPDPVADGGDLDVKVSSSTPGVETLPDGTAFNELTVLDFTAGSASVEVEEITVTRTGLVSDSYIKVSIWVDGERYSNVVTVSEGESILEITPTLVIPAGETVEVTLAANIDASTGTGTVALEITEADDIVTDGGSVTGSFPATGGLFGIVDGSSSVAAATFDIVSLATATRNVDVGQENYEMTRFKISETASKEALYVNGITLFNNGSTADADLINILIKDQNGEPIGSLEEAVDKEVKMVFDEPYEIPKGTTRYLYVYVDVAGGSTRTGQYVVQNDFDVDLEGKSTGAGILATADAASSSDTAFPIGDILNGTSGYNHITVNEGALSITKDNSSPSGDVTLGAADVILGTFSIQAQGEDAELQQIALDFSNGTGRDNASDTTSYFDCVNTVAGACVAASTDLVGSVKVQTESGKTIYTVAANTYKLWDFASRATYATLSAYHTVPAGTTEKLYIVGSINSSSTYTGSGEQLKVGVNRVYYYKKNSLKYASTGSAAANTMSVTTSALSVSKDTSYGDQTIVAGTSGVKIGQFNVKASSAEGVNITSIGLSVNNENDDSDTGVSNLRMYKGTDGSGTQLGSTQTSVADETAMTVSVSDFTLDAGEEVTVSIYADINSEFTDNTDTVVATISASGISGTGQISQSSATGPTLALALQTITLNTSGTITVANADDNPESKILVAGTLASADDSDVARFKLTANRAENLYLKKLTLRIDTDADDAGVAGAVLYGSESSILEGDVIGEANSLQQDTTRPGYITWTWVGDARPMIPSNSSYYVTVKSNLVSSSEGTVTALTPRFTLADIDVDGTSQLATTNAAVDLVPDSIILGTFTAPTTAVQLAGALAVDDTTVTVGSASATPADAAGNGMLDNDLGYYCFIDVDTGNTYTTGEEIFYVVGADAPASTGIYQIERGIFGTTAAAITPAGNDDLIWCVAAKTGNAHTILDTKVSIVADTTGLDSSAKTSMKLAKFVVTAANNAADPAENKATLQKVRVTVTATNAHATTLYLYPEDKYNNATYRVTGEYVADSVVEFDLTGVAALVSSVYDDIIEGQSRTYSIQANAVTGTNGSLDLQIANLSTDAITAATYGDGGDVLWTDGTNASSWVDQSGTNLNLRYVSWSSSTGTPDTTAPAATNIVSADVGGAGTVGEATDTTIITFDSIMDPVTLSNVIMGTVGVITTTVGGDDAVTLLTFATPDTMTMADGSDADGSGFDTAWSTVGVANDTLTLTIQTATTGVVISNAANTPSGDITLSAGVISDIYGNAHAAYTDSSAPGEW